MGFVCRFGQNSLTGFGNTPRSFIAPYARKKTSQLAGCEVRVSSNVRSISQATHAENWVAAQTGTFPVYIGAAFGSRSVAPSRQHTHL